MYQVLEEREMMPQPPIVYVMSSVLESLEPWLAQLLLDFDVVARHHFTHLVTGIIEQQRLLFRQIEAASPFQSEAVSNFIQVQRIIRNTRLILEQIYYCNSWLNLLRPTPIWRLIRRHADLYNIVS
ncbi:hypothetical protein F8S13_12205 [Chloroflexia bacterium SDU3-3]|nr:hypothetical protein F8S13_12205 [Chloroflexia bacterium SDU3-3]